MNDQPKNKRTILMTGGTGFVGSHFALRNMMTPGCRLNAIVRGENPAHAGEKLLSSLQKAADSYEQKITVETIDHRPIVILGDIKLPLCGISDGDIARLQGTGIDEFWHYAASLNYESHKRSLIESLNVEGVRNVLECARKLRVKRFIYISTAYTAGKKNGVIEEALHQEGTQFNNCYEESKFCAEKIVAEFCDREGIRYSILRPSIVIGPSETKKTGGSRTGLYGFLYGICKMKKILNEKGIDEPIRLFGESDLKINFIPVDQLVDDVMDIVADNFSKNTIYHLSSHGTIHLKRVIEILTEAVGFDNLYLAPFENTEVTFLEKQLMKNTEFYAGYLKNNKIFSRSLPRKWEISESDLFEFAKNARMEFEASYTM